MRNIMVTTVESITLNMRLQYPDDFIDKVICGDNLSVMPFLPDECIDLILTDPPYGIKFMCKDWDKAIPPIETWEECLRVLKPGAFAFVMCIPRQDCLSHMIISLEDAGFNVNFTSLYWTYASGFPKAQNIGKVVAKRQGANKSDDVKMDAGTNGNTFRLDHTYRDYKLTPQAKALNGSYGGFQPKPAVEVIIVAMKPLSEKTYVNQALANKKGVTWLDDCRIPYESEDAKKATLRANTPKSGRYKNNKSIFNPLAFNQEYNPSKGRFPANLLVSDDVLNDGENHKSGNVDGIYGHKEGFTQGVIYQRYSSTDGSFSRFFSLDAWWDEKLKQLPKAVQKTFPFLIVPKASKKEKNKGCESMPYKKGVDIMATAEWQKERGRNPENYKGNKNDHPTVKPIKLGSYLITLGSRKGDVVLDPFCGSGSFCISAYNSGRHFIGIEKEKGAHEIAEARVKDILTNMQLCQNDEK